MANPTVEDWLTEIDNGLEYREKFGRESSWTKLENSYLNDPQSDAAIGPNLIYSMGDSLMSSLTVPDPEFVVTPEHPSGVDRAPIVEAVDNWLVRKLKIKRVVDAAALHMYLYAGGFIKIGYDSEFGWSPYYDLGTQDSPIGATLTQFDKKGKRIEYKDTIPGMPWIAAVPPHDIVFPWGTIFIEDAPWFAHRIIRETEQLKKDPKYINTNRLQPQISMEDFMASYCKVMGTKKRPSYKSTGHYFANKQPKFSELWEIHDRMTGMVFVVSRDYDKYLRSSIDAMQVCGLPLVGGSFVAHPRSIWTTPLAFYLGQIQRDQFDISKQQAKQRRISNLKFIMQKNTMTEAELTRLISGDVGAVGIADTNRPLSDVLTTVPTGNFLDFILLNNQTRGDAREMIGYSRNQMGEFDTSSRRTAREATFVESGSQRRTSRRAGVIVEMYIDLITKLNQVCFSFWRRPRFATVEGKWVQFTGDELRGDYLYDVSLSTKRSLSRAQRKVEAMMMLLQFAQIPGVDLPKLYQYAIDASSDPHFETLLAPGARGGWKGAPTAQGGLPTIPSTKTEK